MNEGYLYVACGALLQVGWLFAAEKFSAVHFRRAFQWKNSLKNRLLGLMPAIGYLLFGIGNVVMLGKAMSEEHGLSSSVVYACWSGMVIFLAAFSDGFRSRKFPGWKKLFFLGCIMAGTIILQISTRA